MISKSRIKDIKALHLPKFRQIYNKFIAEGDKVCIEFIKTNKYHIDHIYISEGYENKYKLPGFRENADVTVVSSGEMKQISLLKTPSDILMLLDKKEDDVNELLNSGGGVLYLDGVQDPGNVGTIIRIADWFGIAGVIRSEQSVDFFNPKVVQSSMGSMVNVLLTTCDIEKIIPYGRNLFGTFMEGSLLSDIQLPQDAVLVFGSEGSGISPRVAAAIKNKITIGGAEHKIAESLNVSVAAGIICSQWKSQC